MTIMLRGRGADEFNEPGVGNIADAEAQQEPIPERFEFITLRHFVARAEERDQWELHLLAAVVENPLIDDLQKRVQDSAACLEDFIEEDEFGLDKFTSRDAHILVALEPADRHRPEELFRSGKSRHQVGEA